MEDKRAVAGLWAVPGLGPKTIDKIAAKFRLAEITDCLIGEWVGEFDQLPTYAAERIPHGRSLGDLGDELLDGAARSQMKLAWRGEREYPGRLAEIPDAPQLLFYWGPGTAAPRRRRVAMVGTRRPDAICIESLSRLIRQVAGKGIGVVSGAAFGIDTLAHRTSAKAEGETWAFVGSALDVLDLHQRKLWNELAPLGATFWSEHPPGVRAERKHFPRRNRLISGAADAVAVLRAKRESGSKHTVRYAERDKRPVIAWPGEGDNPFVAYCLEIIRTGKATLCLGVEDVMEAVGVTGYASHMPAPVDTPAVDLKTLSPAAQAAFDAIDFKGKCFDDLLEQLAFRSSQLISAMFELTTNGFVVEHKGRRYEKV